MARMIPSTIDREAVAPGERDVFAWLRDDPATDDWVVLHSFDLPRHATQIQGEIDFVVIIPGAGVVSLEIKSHRSVARRADGKWLLGQDRPVTRSPFKQAADANFSLKAHVESKNAQLRSIPFVSAVCFTRCTFDIPPTEWEPWQVIDEPALTRNPLSHHLTAATHHARKKFAERNLSFADDAPTVEQVQALVQVLRPSFEVYQSAGARAREISGELLRFTEEQYGSLDVCSLNKQVLLRGGAGTGKTLLALEQARRLAQNGERVLLCCFNRNLRKWLAEQVAGSDREIEVHTIHSLMVEITGDQPPPNASKSFWDEDLPAAAVESLLDSDADELFSAIVIDEAQDLFYEPFLDVLDLSVARGLAEGSVVMFADFEWQAIYRHGQTDPTDVASQRFPSITQFPLRMNCRNVPRIGAFVTNAIGDADLYRGFRRGDNGVDPEVRFYATPEDEVELLERSLESLRIGGFRSEDIAVLSFSSDEASAAARLSQRWSGRLAPIGRASPVQGRWCSIHAFKGLDAPAVILTGLSALDRSWDQALLYVGSSRPTDRLVVLADERIRSDVARMLL